MNHQPQQHPYMRTSLQLDLNWIELIWGSVPAHLLSRCRSGKHQTERRRWEAARWRSQGDSVRRKCECPEPTDGRCSPYPPACWEQQTSQQIWKSSWLRLFLETVPFGFTCFFLDGWQKNNQSIENIFFAQTAALGKHCSTENTFQTK